MKAGTKGQGHSSDRISITNLKMFYCQPHEGRKKELTCDLSPSTRMLAAGRFINLGKKELTRDFTPSMGLFQCNNHCRHYKKAWDKITSSLLKPEGCPGGA